MEDCVSQSNEDVSEERPRLIEESANIPNPSSPKEVQTSESTTKTSENSHCKRDFTQSNESGCSSTNSYGESKAKKPTKLPLW